MPDINYELKQDMQDFQDVKDGWTIGTGENYELEIMNGQEKNLSGLFVIALNEGWLKIFETLPGLGNLVGCRHRPVGRKT